MRFVRAKTRHERGKDNESMKNNEGEFHQSILGFENAYGTIPEKISCSCVSVTKRDISAVTQPRAWVADSQISPFMKLFNEGYIAAFDTAFITLFRSAVLQKTIDTHADFLQQFIGRSLESV